MISWEVCSVYTPVRQLSGYYIYGGRLVIKLPFSSCFWCIFLTLGAHAQRGYDSWVCVSVKSHLTSGASVCPENTVTYSAGNGGQKIGDVFSETTPLLRQQQMSDVETSVPFSWQSGVSPPPHTCTHLHSVH